MPCKTWDIAPACSIHEPDTFESGLRPDYGNHLPSVSKSFQSWRCPITFRHSKKCDGIVEGLAQAIVDCVSPEGLLKCLGLYGTGEGAALHSSMLALKQTARCAPPIINECRQLFQRTAEARRSNCCEVSISNAMLAHFGAFAGAFWRIYRATTGQRDVSPA